MNSRWNLIALDAATGRPIRGFGDTGVVDLTRELARNGKPVNKLHYTQTSPPVVWRDLVIVGNGVADKLDLPERSAGRRAGVRRENRQARLELQSRCRSDRRDEGAETWTNESWSTTGHTNVWAPFSVDERRGFDLPPGQHAEQRLVRRRAQGRQSLRRVDRLPRREERASACGTSRRCITVCGTTTFRRRRCSATVQRRRAACATSSPCRRRWDSCSCSIAPTESRSGRSSSARCRRATCPGESGVAIAARSDEAEAVRETGIRLRRSRRLHAGDQGARARRDQRLSRRSAVHAAVARGNDRDAGRDRRRGVGRRRRSIRARARSTSRRRTSRRCTRSCSRRGPIRSTRTTRRTCRRRRCA